MADKPNKNLEDARSRAMTTYKRFNLETMEVRTFEIWMAEMAKTVFNFNVVKAMLNPDIK